MLFNDNVNDVNNKFDCFASFYSHKVGKRIRQQGHHNSQIDLLYAFWGNYVNIIASRKSDQRIHLKS